MTTRNTPGSSGASESKGTRRSTADTTSATTSAAPMASEMSGTPPRGANQMSNPRTPGGSTALGESDHGGNGARLVDRMKERASAQITSQMNRATEGLGSVASAVKGATQQLRNNNQETAARIVEKTAEQVERFSTRLREKDLGELVRDAERLARRQPAMFIGGAIALGIVAARFLKSSTERNRDSWATEAGRGPHDRSY
jgi:hypothetical protein